LIHTKEWLEPRADREEPGVDGRPGVERRSGQMPDQVERPPRLPAERDEVGRTRRRSLASDVPLNEDVHGGELERSIVEEPPQDRRRRAERHVADYAERRRRERDPKGVIDHDLNVRGRTEPSSQLGGESLLDLDRNDVSSAASERSRQTAEPWSDLEHELVGADAGLADELRSDRVATKEMLSASRLPARAPARVWRAHGPSP